jgi:hypothetical protein
MLRARPIQSSYEEYVARARGSDTRASAFLSVTALLIFSAKTLSAPAGSVV